MAERRDCGVEGENLSGKDKGLAPSEKLEN